MQLLCHFQAKEENGDSKERKGTEETQEARQVEYLDLFFKTFTQINCEKKQHKEVPVLHLFTISTQLQMH